MEKKDFLCIGHITHDHIITPSMPEGVDSAGGTAYYVAWAMQHLPHDVHFGVVTAIGNDLYHEAERLSQAGIDIEVHPSKDSVFFENRYEEDMNKRHQRVLSKATPFTIDMLRTAEAEVFHLGTLLQDDFAPEVVEYLATKGRVCIDVQGYLREVRGQKVYPTPWHDMMRVLKSTDILKVNEHEIDVLTNGQKDLHEAAKSIRSWGVREVLITLGSYGSVIYADDHFYDIPGYPPRQAVDATGCGDTYAAGYLYARAKGADYEEAGRMAAAMCTQKLEHTGPFDGTIDDINRIIKDNHGK
ncbi:MAG: bifunctional hydroxymethylpyrimidine kinase/phosphomethylpyrimidine kinase [Prevotella sp.]|nr:bifunctional hydroxymethylpyrimidine kinase/phosphomethylpyrimidine kinase [Prevotella sp.]